MKRWVGDPPNLRPFRLGPLGVPLDVTVTRRVVKPGTAGPRPTGEVRVRRYVGGVLVSEKRTEAGADS